MSAHRSAGAALAPFSKAVAGAVASAVSTTLVAIGTAMSDGDLTRTELIVAIGAGLVVGAGAGGGAVYAAPKNVD